MSDYDEIRHDVVDCPFQRDFGKWDEGFKNINKKLDSIESKVDKQNGRVRKLEIAVGRIMIVGSILLVVIPILIKELLN